MIMLCVVLNRLKSEDYLFCNELNITNNLSNFCYGQKLDRLLYDKIKCI